MVGSEANVTQPIITLTMNPAIDVSTSVQRLVPVQKLRCAPERRDPGGGGINVARVIQRLGGKATAIFPAGGANGRRLETLLAEEMTTCKVVPISGETREDFSVFEEGTGRQYRFVLPGPRLQDAEWRNCLEACAGSSLGERIICASGSLPPGAPHDFYGQLARRVAAEGGRLVLDTSGEALQLALQARVFLVKPNLQELQELTGRALESLASMVQACGELIGRGLSEMVTLTLGAEGALLVTAQGAWRAPPLQIKPVSAVGAGDSFLGAMVFGLASGESAESSFRLAVAAGSAALLAHGTELCRREDVLRLVHDVIVEPAATPAAASD
jgi:6-phosphofructokinase 2